MAAWRLHAQRPVPQHRLLRHRAARKLVQHDALWFRGMKTNVTLKVDADLLREVRIIAAEQGRSVSALLSERLEAIVRERNAFEKARRRALSRLREGLDLQWVPPRSRDELHER
jgi:predicted transcriptional regulator